MYYTERSVASRRNLDFLPLRLLPASYELCYPFLCFEPAEQRARRFFQFTRALRVRRLAVTRRPFDARTQNRSQGANRSRTDHPPVSSCPLGRAPLFSFSTRRQKKAYRRDKMSKHCELARVCGLFSLLLRHVLPTFAWHRAFVFIRSLAVQGVECRATRYNPFCWRTFSYLRPSSDSPPGSSHRAPLPYTLFLIAQARSSVKTR